MNQYFEKRYSSTRLLTGLFGIEESPENPINKVNKTFFTNNTQEYYPYVETDLEIVECFILTSMDKTSLILWIVIPITVYILTSLVCLFIYFRYRKIKKEYEVLAGQDYFTTKTKEDKKIDF